MQYASKKTLIKRSLDTRSISALSFLLLLPCFTAHAAAEHGTAPLKKLLGQLSVYEKAAQVLMVPVSGNKRADAQHIALFKGTVPDAILLFGYNIAESPRTVAAFLHATAMGFRDAAVQAGNSFIPPLYAIDNEGGTVYRTRHITAPLAAAEDIGKQYTADEAEELYRLLAIQMKELGLHLNLAPVAEAGADETKAALGTRTFSTDITKAGRYAAAAVRGMQKTGILAAVKHFPGNGTTDLHEGASVLTISYSALLNRYCASFQLPIADGAAAVLISHITVPIIENIPFCFSAKGIAVLRKELSFSGLIITDDIAMQSLRQNSATPEENAVCAIAAGCDMVMCSLPKQYTLIQAIAEKARSSTVFAKRLDEAVLHVLSAKYKAGLINPYIPIGADGFYIPHTPDWERFRQAKNEATAYRRNDR